MNTLLRARINRDSPLLAIAHVLVPDRQNCRVCYAVSPPPTMQPQPLPRCVLSYVLRTTHRLAIKKNTAHTHRYMQFVKAGKNCCSRIVISCDYCYFSTSRDKGKGELFVNIASISCFTL